MSLPMCTRVSAADPSSDWRSVFTAMNSTPSTWASTIRLTAFTPAPPTPITRSTGSVIPSAEGTNEETGSWIGSGRRSGWRSSMFSGMSEENTERRRSSGVGTPS